MSKVRSITEAQRQPATYADVLTVINTASSMIAALEARIVTLEKALACDVCGDPADERFVCGDCKQGVAADSTAEDA